MQSYQFSIQRFAAFMIGTFAVAYLFLIGKFVLAPLIFAVLLAFLLLPTVVFYERKIKNAIASILLAMASVILPLVGVIILVGAQMGNMLENVKGISTDLSGGIERLLRWLALTFNLPKEQVETWLSDNMSSFVDLPTKILTSGVGSSMQIAGSILLCLLFIFFILLYRRSFHQFFLYQFDDATRNNADGILYGIVGMTKEYLNGLLIVMLILAVLNSLGLFLIGIPLALFWGMLGAVLAIIPYVGTTLGGLLPFIYALATFGFSWQPLAVVLFYAAVQSIEGNFITPKIVGNSVEINPFIAILALVIGGAFWGVSGMILSLPLVAIVRIIFANIDVFKPVSELLSDDIYKREDEFAEKYDANRFRLLSLFQKR